MPRLPKADTALERAGKWFTFEPGIELLIASINSPGYSSAVRDLMRPQGGRMRSASPLDALEGREQDLKRIAGEHLLIGWRGIDDDNGQPVEYSRERSVEYMMDPAYHALYTFCTQVAANEGEYRAKLAEEARGN